MRSGHFWMSEILRKQLTKEIHTEHVGVGQACPTFFLAWFVVRKCKNHKKSYT